MCVGLSKPKTPSPPAIPKEPAKTRLPDGGNVASDARRRVTDRRRSAAQTNLTRGSVLTPATTSATQRSNTTVLGRTFG